MIGTPLDPADDLEKEALSVILATAEMPYEDRTAILEEWSEQSGRHGAAMARAQEQWALFGSVPAERPKARERLQLGIELGLTQAAEHPGRTVMMSAVAIVLVGSIFAATSFQSPANQPLLAELEHPEGFERQMTRYTTGPREQNEIELPDGSRLWLNWNSEVLVADLGGEVHVDVLLGDAMFAPSNNEDKALVVHAGEAYAYDPSTEFAVHTHGLQDAAFAVKSGVLSLTSKARETPIHLAATQQVYILKGESGDIQPVSARSIGDWREEQIVFDERPLLDAIYSLSHYTKQPVQVGLIDEPYRRVTATYSMREADDALVELAHSFDLMLDHQTAENTLIWSVGGERP